MKEKGVKFFGEFKNFAVKGNALDLAIGVIIGGAFGKIVTSLVNDLIMPLASLITGGLDFSDKFIALDGNSYPTLAAAKEVGAATFNYGNFITAVIDFVIIAFSIFLVVRQINRFKKSDEKEPEAPKTKKCAFCKSEISIDATRCPHCTSELETEGTPA